MLFKEEDIVDWNEPMLSQVGSLGHLYESWVWRPVDRPLRLFRYDWMEKLTRTDWRQVVGVWVPVIIVALAFSFYNSPSDFDSCEYGHTIRFTARLLSEANNCF